MLLTSNRIAPIYMVLYIPPLFFHPRPAASRTDRQCSAAQEAGLPLWLRPYEVLVTSNRTALIEMVPNAPSLHTIKSRSAPGTSLAAHFFAKFGRVRHCVAEDTATEALQSNA